VGAYDFLAIDREWVLLIRIDKRSGVHEALRRNETGVVESISVESWE